MSVDTEDRVADLLERATRAAADGDAATAGALAVEAAALLPPDDPDRYATFVSAAQLLGRAGQHAAAADAWAQAAAEAADDATRARDLTAEGEAARLAGAWPRAAASHERALGLAEHVHGESVATAVIAQNLAMTYKYTGRFDDAEALYRRALAIVEAADEQPLVAVICHNLGGLAHARGDHAAGIPWTRRSVRVRETLDEPLGLAADRGALAGLLIEAGELREARALLLAARQTFVEHLGDDNHEVAVVDGNLATIALRTGNLVLAERRARDSLRVKERCLGTDHPELAVTLTTLGTIRRRRGDRSGAARQHRRALALLSPAVEPDHPLLQTVEENLAACSRRPTPPARRKDLAPIRR